VKRAKTMDEYLANLEGERRKALDKLRATIRKVVPRAEETISYGIPAFRLNGKVIAGFMARRNGCSYIPFSGTTLAALAHALEGYAGTKSSLHFDPARGLPAALVRKLIKTRIAETK
jgi:uncharacterized protein YdhG (YjbR/CyaY superfamily)